MNRYHATVAAIEAFFAKYIVFADPSYSLPLALWIIGTFVYQDFDAFPYVVITAATKRSGKTRLSELMSMVCKNPQNLGALTPAGVFHSMDSKDPVVLFSDEAEELSSEGATQMRAVLNMGYRKGQSVRRIVHGEPKDYPTYCPKVFILIGDVADTLKDRSVIIRMKRGNPPGRFVFEPVRAEGAVIRARIEEDLQGASAAVAEAFLRSQGLEFLTDRDEELWTPLFAIASVFCPDRIEELQRYAVDIATEKTQESARYTSLLGEEKKAEQEEYALRLLADIRKLMHGHKQIETKVLIEQLHGLTTSPWRKFRGDGLSIRNIADMLSPFGVSPGLVRIGPRAENNVKRGYKAADIERAAKKYLPEGSK